MNDNTDLTIVIPAFRCAAYLEATVCSALRSPARAIVIAEDCSGDDTLGVANAMGTRYPERVLVRANSKNLGMTGNWQQAVRTVETAFALKLDGDDILSPSYARRALAYLQANPGTGIIGATKTDIGSDEFCRPDIEDWITEGEEPQVTSLTGAAACRQIIKWEPYPCSSSTMYRMRAWREAGGYDERLGWCSDREIWFRIAEKRAIAIMHCNGVLYRHHAGSVTSATGRSRRFAQELETMFTSAAIRWNALGEYDAFRRAWWWTSRVYAGAAWRSLENASFATATRMAAGAGRCILRGCAPRLLQ